MKLIDGNALKTAELLTIISQANYGLAAVIDGVQESKGAVLRRTTRDVLEPFHEYQGLDLTKLYDTCDAADAALIPRNVEHMVLKCDQSQNNSGDLNCKLSCEESYKFTEFASNDYKHGNLNCHRLSNVGERNFYYWTYESGSVDRDFNECVYVGCPHTSSIKSSYKFAWKDNFSPSTSDNILIGEASITKAKLKQILVDQILKKEGLVKTIEDIDEMLLQHGWTMIVKFNSPISNGMFSTYYGQNLSTDKKGTFFAFTSFKGKKSRVLGKSGKSFDMDFVLIPSEGEVFDEGLEVADIEFVIGEYANLQCLSNDDNYGTAGIIVDNEVMRSDDDSISLPPNYCGMVPFELGKSNSESNYQLDCQTTEEKIQEYTNQGWYTTNDSDLPVVYKFFNDELTWQGARDYCASNGYGLASVYTKAENDLITSYDFNKGWKFWSGGNDLRSSRIWEWVAGINGEPDLVTYTNWLQGAPSTLDENCMQMNKPGGTWNDDGCHLTMPFVCQIRFTPESCTGNYHVNAKMMRCIKNTCTCENGLAVENSICTSHGSNLCQSCLGNFHLENGNCVPNKCACENGKAISNEKCTEHGSNICGSCDEDYLLINESSAGYCQDKETAEIMQQIDTRLASQGLPRCGANLNCLEISVMWDNNEEASSDIDIWSFRPYGHENGSIENYEKTVDPIEHIIYRNQYHLGPYRIKLKNNDFKFSGTSNKQKVILAVRKPGAMTTEIYHFEMREGEIIDPALTFDVTSREY